MGNNTVVNSSAKNNYFTAGGAAIGASTQPLITASTIAGIVDSSIGKSADKGIISSTIFRSYTGYDRVSILDGASNTLRGSANTIIRSPGSDSANRKSILKMNAARTSRVRREIRAGNWNMITGGFLSGLTTYNDFAALGTDAEAASNRAIPGAFAFAYGSGVSQRDYPARTQ